MHIAQIWISNGD